MKELAADKKMAVETPGRQNIMEQGVGVDLSGFLCLMLDHTGLGKGTAV